MVFVLIGNNRHNLPVSILIERKEAYGRRSYISVGVILSLAPLIIFKYYNFLTENIGDLFSAIGIKVDLPGLNWAIPIGISFYSFQAVGYLFDVYYKPQFRNIAFEIFL